MFKPQVSKRWAIPIPSIFVFAVLPLVVTLTGAHLAQAGGFNVDSLVTFTPLASTYRTTSNTTGCPAGYAGKFTFTAQLTNKPDSPAMPGLDIYVQTLTNGNLLLDPQTNTVLGGEGAVMEVTEVGQYADGLLSADETVDVPFVVCLKTRQSFQFFVDVFAVVTELVSVNRFGTNSGNRLSSDATLSADGRFVVFHSYASDLVTNDTNGEIDVFVRDLQTGTTTLVSVNRFGTTSGNGSSGGPGGPSGVAISALSADGRLVAFSSNASDLVANDTNGEIDVFVRDLQTGTTTLVSVNRFGTNGGNANSWMTGIGSLAFSADGRFVVFESDASDLVANDTNESFDVFVRDLQTDTTALVSVNRLGTDSANFPIRVCPPVHPPICPKRGSFGHAISANGRFVLFTSSANDLVAIDTNGEGNVFVRDLQTATTTLVSVNRAGTNSGNSFSRDPAISADGRFVTFSSWASDLVENDSNGSVGDDVFVRDLQTGTTTLVSVNQFGTNSGNSPSSNFGLSADGRLVLFTSSANDLVANDTNGEADVFVRDLQTGTTTLVSVNRFGTNGGNGASGDPRLSADGRFVAFRSSASDLVNENDTNRLGGNDVFVRDLQTATTTLMSVNRAGTDSGNNNSGGFAMSTDGRFVAFESFASDLVTIDTNDLHDIFVRPVP